ncbi:MAG TPA: type VI secretion system baseplate subunit TssG [Pirellulaceae bacterium]|nr:type VI secretion system baseplate subunit TssG [Pirellulaceae bacterium]
MSTVAPEVTSLSEPANKRSRRVPELLPDDAPVAERLFTQPQQFDFFQAVRLLELLQPTRREIGSVYSPDEEIVSFRAELGTAFPPSSIADLTPAADDNSPPEMTIAFLGLTGPTGILPAHYSELLLRLKRDYRTPEKHAIAAWLDLFNHRLTSLFYRAWEKYRPWVAYQRGDYRLAQADTFTHGVQSLSGLASVEREYQPGLPAAFQLPRSLIRYAGLLSQRPRNVANLQAILADYFALPIEVVQFQGQWLALAEEQQTRLGVCGQLGFDTVVGTRMWDRQSKIRIRVGPLSRQQFECLLPEGRSSTTEQPHLAELSSVVRFYLGSEIDFDIQLVLNRHEVPAPQLRTDANAETRLGWNAWLPSEAPPTDRADAVFTTVSLA